MRYLRVSIIVPLILDINKLTLLYVCCMIVFNSGIVQFHAS